jgi:outer membrane lipase/esterase
MKFKLDVVRSAVMAALAVAMLASCGGGTQIESFSPQRVIAFGDETSLIEPNSDGQGRKYTVNGVEFFTDTSVTPNVVIPVSPTKMKCTSNPIWVQQMAAGYNLGFAECAGDLASPNGEMWAERDAKAATLGPQVDLFMAGNNGTFRSNDLVTVMVGMNDVIDLYSSNQPNPTANSSALIEAARQAGTEVGAQVVRITDRGAKVIVSTIPDMGLSPFAAKEEANNPGEGRAALLSRLSTEFNTRLRLKLQDVRDGGRAVGLILADELVLAMTNNPSLYNITNVNQGACVTASLDDLLECDQTTTQDSVAGQSYGSAWLWADDTHLGPNAQSRLGSAAESRARNNPF